MKTYAIHFIIGLFLAIFAFLDLPFTPIFDKLIIIILGLYIALSSYGKLNRQPKEKLVHDEEN